MQDPQPSLLSKQSTYILRRVFTFFVFCTGFANRGGGGKRSGIHRSFDSEFFTWWYKPLLERASAAARGAVARVTPMRIEPKTYFANERTFLTWLHMAVTLGTVAAAMLGFSGTAEPGKKGEVRWEFDFWG